VRHHFFDRTAVASRGRPGGLAARIIGVLSIRYWAAIATALATAALVDFSSELLANAGWLGGLSTADGHQEGVLPVALLATLVAVALGLTVALRAGRGEQTRYREASAANRVTVAIATLAVTFVVITLMEAYEMRFGGVSALDPRSVFVEHWPAVVLGYVVVAAIFERLVSFILGIAVAGGKLAAFAIVAFLRVNRSVRAAASRAYASFGARALHRPLVLALGALALRAPPPLQLLTQQQLLS
jgi:hypothetical protein